jgi:hypothetical protein
METSSPRTPQQQRLEGVGSTIVVGRKLSGGGSELGVSPRVGPRAVAGFLAWADFDNPTKWCRRFFVLHDGWLYRFPNANIVTFALLLLLLLLLASPLTSTYTNALLTQHYRKRGQKWRCR